jgi:Zn-dependent oligopeptidase
MTGRECTWACVNVIEINSSVEQAKLMGYPTHAHFILEIRMAKEPANVQKVISSRRKKKRERLEYAN